MVNTTVFINESGVAWSMITGLTTHVTGDLFLTFLMLMIIVLIFATMFRLPFIATILFMLPMFLAGMAYYQDFVAIGGVALIYVGLVMGDLFFFSKS